MKRSLIAAAREKVTPDEMVDWYLCVARGYEPPPFGADPNVVDVGPRARVPLEASMAAWKMLREIAHGVPAQAEYVERMWREHLAAQADDQVDPRALTDEELDLLAEADARVLEIHERAAARPRALPAPAIPERRALPPPPRAPAVHPIGVNPPGVSASTHPAAAFVKAPKVKAPEGPAPRIHMFEGSSAVSAIRFTAADGRCVVTFPGGARFTYGGFTDALVDAWLNAPSPGRWFHHHVRKNAARHPVLEKSGAALGEVRSFEVL